MEQKPSIGRIVTYHCPPEGIHDSRDVAAVVTSVDDADEGRVTLTVFEPNQPPRPLMHDDVSFDESGAEGTWRWPDRL